MRNLWQWETWLPLSAIVFAQSWNMDIVVSGLLIHTLWEINLWSTVQYLLSFCLKPEGIVIMLCSQVTWLTPFPCFSVVILFKKNKISLICFCCILFCPMHLLHLLKFYLFMFEYVKYYIFMCVHLRLKDTETVIWIYCWTDLTMSF